MGYSEELAGRVRKIFDGDAIEEKKMFGGLCFMRRGHMCCGVQDEVLVLRLGNDLTADALKEPHTRPMNFTGRVLKSMVYVDPPAIQSGPGLRKWVKRAVAYNDTQKPK